VESVETTKVGRNMNVTVRGLLGGQRFTSVLLATPESQVIGDDAIYAIVFAFFGIDEIS